MTLYPFSLRYSEIAALDLPVPETLIDHVDREQWRDYASLTSPGRLLAKFGQALDQFHAAIDGADLDALSDDRRVSIYSKWEAAQITAASAATRLGFSLPRETEDSFGSDIGQALFFVMKFVEDIESTQLDGWRKRATRHDEIRASQPTLSRFLDDVYQSHVMPAKPGPNARTLHP